MARWQWRTKQVEEAVEQRALGKALYTGDFRTATSYLAKIQRLIEMAEAHPEGGRLTSKQHYRFKPLAGSPGDGEVVIWSWDGSQLIGEGVYQSLPPEFA